MFLKKLLSLSLMLFFIFPQLAMAQNCCQPQGCNQCVQQCCPAPCQQQEACQCENCCLPGIEHLCANKNSPVDLVKICGCQAMIQQHAVIEATFAQRVYSKKLCPGDNIAFNLPNGLCTREGRKLIPCGSKIIACVDCIVPPKKFNKSARISLKFHCILLPNGKSYPLCARIFNSEGMLKETKWMAAGKVAAYTIGLMGVGAGLGAAIGAGSRHAGQAALTIGMPVGFGVGLLTGLMTPGLHYRAKCGEKVLIQLTDNLEVDTNCCCAR